MKCEYDVTEKFNGRRVTVNCRECENAFAVEKCFPSMMDIMIKEYNINHIIFSDQKETLIKGDAVKLFSRLGALLKELDRLSSRTTDGADCHECESSPLILFGTLKETLRRDPKSTFKVYQQSAYALMKADGCSNCRKTTKEDLKRVGDELISISSNVRHKAYGIIG